MRDSMQDVELAKLLLGCVEYVETGYADGYFVVSDPRQFNIVADWMEEHGGEGQAVDLVPTVRAIVRGNWFPGNVNEAEAVFAPRNADVSAIARFRMLRRSDHADGAWTYHAAIELTGAIKSSSGASIPLGEVSSGATWSRRPVDIVSRTEWERLRLNDKEMQPAIHLAKWYALCMIAGWPMEKLAMLHAKEGPQVRAPARSRGGLKLSTGEYFEAEVVDSVRALVARIFGLPPADPMHQRRVEEWLRQGITDEETLRMRQQSDEAVEPPPPSRQYTWSPSGGMYVGDQYYPASAVKAAHEFVCQNHPTLATRGLGHRYVAERVALTLTVRGSMSAMPSATAAAEQTADEPPPDGNGRAIEGIFFSEDVIEHARERALSRYNLPEAHPFFPGIQFAAMLEILRERDQAERNTKAREAA